jgi:hypothetical protein
MSAFAADYPKKAGKFLGEGGCPHCGRVLFEVYENGELLRDEDRWLYAERCGYRVTCFLCGFWWENPEWRRLDALRLTARPN